MILTNNKVTPENTNQEYFNLMQALTNLYMMCVLYVHFNVCK